MFSVKRAVRKYILCYTFIHKLMSNRLKCFKCFSPPKQIVKSYIGFKLKTNLTK